MATRLRGVPVGLAVAALLALASRLLPETCIYNELGRTRAEHTGDLSLGPAPRGAQLARFAAACGAAATPPLAPHGPIHRHPYLQKVTARSATVLWTGAPLEAPAVRYWLARAPAAAQTVAAAVNASAPLDGGRQYAAELGRLTPGQVVCYQLRDGGRPLAGPFGFAAAPEPAAAGAAPIRIAALGDMGWRSSDQDAVRAQLGDVEFDLALMAGDIAYPSGRLSEYEENVFPVYGPLMASAPFFAASGNHDYLTDDGGPFRQVFALPENGGAAGRERWYSTDWGDLHLVVLDTEKVGEAQAAWLEADLTAAAGARWTIALFHKPPFSSGEIGPDQATRDSLVPILTRHHVALVITGHDHDYERREPVDGVSYLMTGGGGRGTRRITSRGKGSAFAEQVAHFVYLQVGPDEIRLWAIDGTGQTFDTARIPRAR